MKLFHHHSLNLWTGKQFAERKKIYFPKEMDASIYCQLVYFAIILHSFFVVVVIAMYYKVSMIQSSSIKIKATGLEFRFMESIFSIKIISSYEFSWYGFFFGLMVFRHRSSISSLPLLTSLSPSGANVKTYKLNLSFFMVSKWNWFDMVNILQLIWCDVMVSCNIFNTCDKLSCHVNVVCIHTKKCVFVFPILN